MLNYRRQAQEVVDSYTAEQPGSFGVREARHDFIHCFCVKRTFAQEDVLGSIDQLRDETREIVRTPSLARTAGSRMNHHDR